MKRLKKQLKFVFGLTLMIMMSGCFSIPKTDKIDQSRLEKIVQFNQIDEGKEIPLTVVLYLPNHLIRQLPQFLGSQEDLWPWVFQNAIDPAFKNTTVISDSSQLHSLPGNTIIIQPELWGYFFRRYGLPWNCWFDFKFTFLDSKLYPITSIKTDGTSTGEDLTQAFASTMNEIISTFQKELTHQRRETLLKFSNNQ